MNCLNGVFILDGSAFEMIYGPDERASIHQKINLVAPALTKDLVAADLSILNNIDVIFSGWGAPLMDEAFLNHAPRLKAVFYGSGAIGSWVTNAVWSRNITVSSAIDANSIPVAEYTLATILFSLKHGWSLARRTRDERTFPDRNNAPGCYQRTVGLISLGAVARKVIEFLKPFELNVIAYDPFVTAAEATKLGIKLVPLDELFRQCDVVSLHTPLLDETVGMISGKHLLEMKQGATFINTARGEIVREQEMISALAVRPDLHAILDVTEIEPPSAESPLYVMPNVTLTPHIAGSVGNECRRMGRCMVEELDRYLRGEPLKWQVVPDATVRSTHQATTPKLKATVYAANHPPARVAL